MATRPIRRWLSGLVLAASLALLPSAAADLSQLPGAVRADAAAQEGGGP